MIILRCHRSNHTVRITLPRPVARSLDILPGDSLIFESLGQGIGRISHEKLWTPTPPKVRK